MVDLDTTGEGQEVELQEEESTKEEKVEEEKVEASTEEQQQEKTKEDDSKEDDSKEDDGLDKYSKNVQRRIKKLLDRVEKTEQREQEALRFAETAKKKYEDYETADDVIATVVNDNNMTTER